MWRRCRCFRSSPCMSDRTNQMPTSVPTSDRRVLRRVQMNTSPLQFTVSIGFDPMRVSYARYLPSLFDLRPVDCVQKILRQRGLLGIYHGFASTLLREVPGGMAYFTAYETVKKVLTREGSQPAAATLMFAGGMAGVSFWSAVSFNQRPRKSFSALKRKRFASLGFSQHYWLVDYVPHRFTRWI